MQIQIAIDSLLAYHIYIFHFIPFFLLLLFPSALLQFSTVPPCPLIYPGTLCVSTEPWQVFAHSGDTVL